MKKSFVLSFLSLPLILASCGSTAVFSSGNETSSSDESVSAIGSNTLTSVLSNFGTNLTVNATFGFLTQSSTNIPVLNTAYVEKGCYFRFMNFASYTSFGLVDVAAAAKSGVEEGTYKWADDKGVLALGDKVSSTSSFRSLYYDPSSIGANHQRFVDAFVPEIPNAVNGYFYLNNPNYTGVSSDGSSALPYVDHSAEVVLLAKCLGVYDVLSSISSLKVDYAKLYFSEKGSTFTFRIYSKYEGGFNGLETMVTVSKVGKTAIADIDSYLGTNS